METELLTHDAIGRRGDEDWTFCKPEPIAGNMAGGTHHAFRGEGNGYCIFNDLAVAQLALRWGRHSPY